ncbi:MAG: sigma-70 family RNA polymerase sigma factor [Planctomycetota bacterium]
MTGEPGRPDTVVQLLDRVRRGDASASSELLPLIYEELRGLAQSIFRAQNPGHTLQPTVLVHDAFVRLVQSDVQLEGSRHFYAVAAKAMRQILTDHARARHAQKRGGEWARVTISDRAVSGGEFGDVDVLDLEEAMEDLARLNPRHAQLVELRFYGGLTIEEAAEELGVSRQTAVNDWTMARAWLRRELSRGREG